MREEHIMRLKSVNQIGVEEWKCIACTRHILIDPSKLRRENILVAGKLILHRFSPRRHRPKKRQIWA